jgi:hypothetical protein
MSEAKKIIDGKETSENIVDINLHLREEHFYTTK